MSRLSTREAAIADRVRAQRDAAGLSQEQVAQALGLSKAGYGHYDRGDQPFTTDQLFQLSAILGRSVAWFLGLPTDLTPEEDEVLTSFRQANAQWREVIIRSARSSRDNR